MFKKGKKKHREGATKNENIMSKNEENPTQLSNSLSNSPPSRQSDGFDENGFVDLRPVESNATILGPRINCKYVGTFAVMSGTDGERTLKTHKERTAYMKDTLREYRNAANGVKVILQVSTDGIKVLAIDAKRVRMAYPLQRISFATCDPDFSLFAFMTRSPSPTGVAVHSHVFVTSTHKQVQDVTAMIGKAFKLAFASSKLPQRKDLGSQDIVQNANKPVRRWAKHEATRGHDHSEHAEIAAGNRKKTPKQDAKKNRTSTDGSPVMQRAHLKGAGTSGSPVGTPPEKRKARLTDGNGNGLVMDSIAQDFSFMSVSSHSESSSVTTTSTQSTQVVQGQAARTFHEERRFEEWKQLHQSLADTPPRLPPPRTQTLEAVAPALPPRNQSEPRAETPEPAFPPLPPRNQSGLDTQTPEPGFPPLSPRKESEPHTHTREPAFPPFPPPNQSECRAQAPEPAFPPLPPRNQSGLDTQTPEPGFPPLSPRKESEPHTHTREPAFPPFPPPNQSECRAQAPEPAFPPLPPRNQSGLDTQTPEPGFPPLSPRNESEPHTHTREPAFPPFPPPNQSEHRAQAPEPEFPVPLPLRNQSEPRAQTPTEGDALSSMPESQTKTLLGNAGIGSLPRADTTRVEYLGAVSDEKSREESSQTSKATSHHGEYWYMPGIPREFVMEMLQASEEGSFFVRDSQTKPGCHALTVRVPRDVQAGGIGNYLIAPVPEGVKLEGFTKKFPDLMSLIEHYCQYADGLPCKLLLAGSNMLCENSDDEDYVGFDSVDPDYRLMSDFRSMMDELQ